MSSFNRSSSEPRTGLPEVLFVGVLTLLVGVGMLRFGNPVILDDPVLMQRMRLPFGGVADTSTLRYFLVGVLFASSLWLGWRRVGVPAMVVFLPGLWLATQFWAAGSTVDKPLTVAVLKHASACVACFYVGLLAWARLGYPRILMMGLLLAFGGVLAVGFEQHFGGLEATQRHFELYELPKLEVVTPELLKKIQSRRIFSTFVYPNTFACGLLLMLPLVLGFVEQHFQKPSALWLKLGFALASGACLVWTGSKAGWLIAMALGGLWLWREMGTNRWRWGLLFLFLVVGTVAFTIQSKSYFARGATSVVARFDYWKAAISTIREDPLTGSGPGTFGVVYGRIKSPQSEMARLAHNDYLQQWSDSGLWAFVSYVVFIGWSIIGLGRILYRYRSPDFWVWLGCLGWALHSLVDFGLYVPGVAWIAFLCLGWLWGRVGLRKAIDTPPVPG